MHASSNRGRRTYVHQLYAASSIRHQIRKPRRNSVRDRLAEREAGTPAGHQQFHSGGDPDRPPSVRGQPRLLLDRPGPPTMYIGFSFAFARSGRTHTPIAESNRCGSAHIYTAGPMQCMATMANGSISRLASEAPQCCG